LGAGRVKVERHGAYGDDMPTDGPHSMTTSITVRPVLPGDRAAVLAVEAAAFPTTAEAELVAALLDDPSARPVVDLLAEADGRPVGHVLFTAARVCGDGILVPASLLAPLAVVPEAQRRGVGRALIEAGIEALRELDIGLCFVLGHIDYYPRAGFRPALPLGLRAPYEIDPAVADAWMVRETRAGLIGAVRGAVSCADALMHPELWRE
jgi:putative acetyltransferase